MFEKHLCPHYPALGYRMKIPSFKNSSVLKYTLLAFTSFMATSMANAAIPYSPIEFPKDEAAHHNTYSANQLSEWWYYNGKIHTTSGNTFGYFASLNYTRLGTIYFPYIHVQITDLDHQKVYTKFQYFPQTEGSFQKSFDSNSLNHAIANADGSFSVKQNADSSMDLKASVTADDGTPLQLDFHLRPQKPVVLISNSLGFSEMWDNFDTYYYSYTDLQTEGTFQINYDRYVLAGDNSSWMDHQWGDFVVWPWQQMVHPWFWQSIRLDNGIDINLAVIDPLSLFTKRQRATAVLPNGEIHYLEDFIFTPKQIDPTSHYPTVYHLTIPALDLDLDIAVALPGQTSLGISEAISNITGTYQGSPVSGFSYSESTLQL